MNKHRTAQLKAYLRAYVAIALMLVWTIVVFTGFLLWSVPHQPRRGHIELLFGLTKRHWGDIHFWMSIIAVAITILHVAIDWKALKACVRHLTSVRRTGGITNQP